MNFYGENMMAHRYKKISVVLALTVFFIGTAQAEAPVPNVAVSNKNQVCRQIPFPEKSKKYNDFPWKILKMDHRLNENYEKLIKGNVDAKSDDYRWSITNMTAHETSAFHHQTYGDFIGFDECRPHYCDTHNAQVMFDPESKKMVIRLSTDTSSSTFGQLPAELIADCFTTKGK